MCLKVFDHVGLAVVARGSKLDVASASQHDALTVQSLGGILVHGGSGNARARHERGDHRAVEQGRAWGRGLWGRATSGVCTSKKGVPGESIGAATRGGEVASRLTKGVMPKRAWTRERGARVD